MLPLDVKHRWMFVAILFFGILDKNSICDSSDADDKCTQKNVLFVNAKKNIHATFPSKSAYYEVKENKLYFKGTQCTGSKICRFEMMGQENDYSLITNEATLSKHDIVLMNVPDTDFECMLSEPSSTDPGFLLKIRNCSKTDYKSIRLSQNGICGKNSHYNEAACGDLVGQIKIYKFIYNDTTSHCLLCERPETTTPEPTTSTTTTPEPPTSTTTTSTTTTPEPPTSTTTTPEPPTSVTTTPEPTTSTTTTSTTTTPEPTTSTTTTSTTTTPEPTTSTTTTPEPPTSTTTTSTTTTPEPTTSTTTTPEPPTSVTTTPEPTTSTTTTSTTTTPEPPTPVAITVIPPEGNNGTGISPENAANIMENLSYLLEEIGNSNTATVTIGHIKGGITKLLPKASNINFGITASDDVNIFENIDHPVTSFSRLVQIPTEAIAMALKRNSSFAGVLLFPGMYQDDPNSYFLNNELLGIDMGTEISNLSQTIDIHYTSVDKNGSIASCQSWDGKGKSTIWITDGCQTKETSNSITCQCSHLTFFAILLSPPPVNISASDFTSLSYITSVGCGLSMFFLMVALFMHFLIRKGKASQATKILMNLFAAMLTLNLSFLVNESIAELGNFGACMAVAAVMHYTMLATCTWFFIEALHLYFNLWKPNTGKHYMAKICAAGWVTPAVVVIPLLALRQYDYLVIYTDDGNSAKMCWISDAVVHQGVNVGYYAVVFIFTFVVFFMTVRQIVLLKPTAGKSQQNSYTKTNSFSIFGLFVLLGITWGFAFFSHGPLLIASYYLFTILNSFQGFFLFIYYVNSSKNRSPTDGISSTATSDTVTSPQ